MTISRLEDAAYSIAPRARYSHGAVADEFMRHLGAQTGALKTRLSELIIYREASSFAVSVDGKPKPESETRP